MHKLQEMLRLLLNNLPEGRGTSTSNMCKAIFNEVSDVRERMSRIEQRVLKLESLAILHHEESSMFLTKD